VIERVGELYTGSSTSIEARERRLVDTYLIRSGMLRFNLMINVSYPGSLPEPEFLAALLQLVNNTCLIWIAFKTYLRFASFNVFLKI